MQTAQPASIKSVNPSVSTGATSRSMAPSSRNKGASSRSRGVSSRRGVSKQPTPQFSYFRKFPPIVRRTSQLSIVPEGSERPK